MKFKYQVRNDNDEVIFESDNYDELIGKNGTIYAKCDICGEYEHYNYITEYCGEFYCENCRDDNLKQCNHCGEWVSNDLVTRINGRYDDEYWCEECRDSDAFYCDECREYYDGEYYESTWVHDECYCEHCREDVLRWCDHCNQYCYEDEGGYDEEMDMWLCDRCRNEMDIDNRIRGYHQRPRIKYYKNADEYTESDPDFKGFGIELEIDRNSRSNGEEEQSIDLLNEQLGSHVYYNRDGSLNYGYEIISQPHTRAALTSLNWQNALKGLVRLGYRSHDIRSCGLHMHVSRKLFGDSEEERTENIAKIIWFYNQYWGDILKFSRRTQEQADRWAGRYTGLSTFENCKNIAKGYYGRYYAVNLCNSNTVEFRLMRGTLNYKTFMATLDFLMTIAENSKTVTDPGNLEQWLQGIADTTKEYMATRNCFGYSNNNETTEQGDEE